MSNLIKILDPFTANQIAAGEVVERPVSVVKELVENSLDAGASKIEVTVSGAGVELIRVTDNGSGMSREDAELAFQRHATSKISSPADLAAIGTLGFRGEALPSIASVSHLEVLTREKTALTGTQVILDGGKVSKILDVGCPVGTTFVVRDLFFNTPARRKFLKSAATELGQISDLLGRLCMAYPQVAFKYSNEGRILLQTTGSGNLLEAISQVYGKEQARRMIALKLRQAEFSLEGYLGKPDQARASRAQQTFYINGRYVKSKLLTQAVAEGYHTLLPTNKFPIVVLNLSLPLSAVDVNVHPTKLEVRFTQEREIIGFVADCVKRVLYESNLIPGLDLTPHQAERPEDLPQTPRMEVIKPNAAAVDVISQPQLDWQGLQPKPAEKIGVIEQSNSSLAEVKQAGEVAPSVACPGEGVLSEGFNGIIKHEELEDRHSRPLAANYSLAESGAADYTQAKPEVMEMAVPDTPVQKLPDLVPFGQVNLTYIVASGPEGLYVIDQHAAHERINFELLWDQACQGKIESQLLLEPLTLELTPQEMSILIENITLFTDLGFLLEHFGGNTFLVRGYPINLPAGVKLQSVMHDLLDILADGTKQVESRLLRREFIYSLACRSSIKANAALNRAEMEHLIWRLGQTQNPFTCPHGRPTIIAITTGELAKRFQRT